MFDKKSYDRKYFQEHKERINETARIRYKENSEKKRKAAIKWGKENVRKKRKYNKKWREKNPDKARRWCRENPEKIRELDRKRYQRDYKKRLEYDKRWQKANPEKVNFRNKRYRARKRKAKGSHTLQQWQEIKKRYNYCCVWCKKKEPEIKLTEDHIIPLDKNGSDFIENIQPLCQNCNSKKHTKIINFTFTI